MKRLAPLALSALLLASGTAPSMAQDAAVEADAPAETAPAPKPKPKRRPPPRKAPPARIAPEASEGAPAPSDTAPAPAQEAAPPHAARTRPPARKPAPAKAAPRSPAAETAPADKPVPSPVPAPPAAATATNPVPAPPPPTPAANLPGLTVACEGKAALYAGGKGFSLWVTRTGVIAVENPLRPLTPETTRVLQVTIAGKVATAYGPDLYALRRGGSPAALEGQLGGPTRWDAVATALPDTLNIVSETGQPLADLAFQECGEAPAVSAPVAKAKEGAKARAKPRPKASAPGGEAASEPRGTVPQGLHIPQGLIP